MKSDDQIIDAFLAKKRIAVVGASDRRDKWGNKIVRFLVHTRSSRSTRGSTWSRA